MNLMGLILTFLFYQQAYAANAVIDYKEASNGYGTVSGHIEPSSRVPSRVTLRNGGLNYTTLTDNEGHWSVVFRLRSTQFLVTVTGELFGDSEFKISDSLSPDYCSIYSTKISCESHSYCRWTSFGSCRRK